MAFPATVGSENVPFNSGWTFMETAPPAKVNVTAWDFTNHPGCTSPSFSIPTHRHSPSSGASAVSFTLGTSAGDLESPAQYAPKPSPVATSSPTASSLNRIVISVTPCIRIGMEPGHEAPAETVASVD